MDQRRVVALQIDQLVAVRVDDEQPCPETAYGGWGGTNGVVRVLPPGMQARARSYSRSALGGFAWVGMARSA